jgi:hypothetical protein
MRRATGPAVAVRWGAAVRRGVAGGRRTAVRLGLVAAWSLGIVGIGTSLAGCGGGFRAADLFIVQRTGTAPGADLTMVFNEEGAVRCDGGQPRTIGDEQLVLARGIQEDLKEAASEHLVLPARPGSVFGYYLRDENGSVRFADNSLRQSKAMRELQELVLEVGRRVCASVP